MSLTQITQQILAGPVPETIPQTEAPQSQFMAAALRCLEKGWYVFPLGEKSKTPDGVLAPNGFNSSSNDPNQIREWWAKSPNANIGIDLGRSNLTVLDFDRGSPPIELGLPETLIVKTARGTHVYLVGTSKQGKMVLHGEVIGDVKSAGGYVLGPFSQHPDGPIYNVEKAAATAMIPAGVIESLRGERKSSPTIDGDMIPHGQHDTALTSIAGKLRDIGLDEDQINDLIVGVCEKRCENYGNDYKDMCRKIAHSIARYPVGKDHSLLLNNSAKPSESVNVSDWHGMFRSVGEMEQGDVVMVIDGVLQEGTCFIGANPGDGKTLVGLAFAKAVATGTPLFGMPQFPVKKPRTVIYLIPESRDRAFRKRCEAFRMPDDKSKFMARTISSGISLELGDPYLLEAVRQTKAVVFLDTASRFMKGTDENAAAQNRQLVNDVIALLVAGAVCVVLIHHATKAAKAKRETMTLENMLRGSSDLGAMCDQAYGIRKDMGLYANGAGPMEIDMVNLKDREQIGGLASIRLAASYRKGDATFPVSYINEEGNFRLVSDIETQNRSNDSLVSLVQTDPNLPEKELAVRTGLSEYSVKRNLNRLGWHRVKGGPAGASPWHQDLGTPCPFGKPAVGNPKPGIAEAVAYLREELAGTEPGAPYTGVAEADIFSGADERGFPDTLIAKAKKRLGVLVSKDRQWSLPGAEEGEPIQEPGMLATNR